jgi:hypothetical protein
LTLLTQALNPSVSNGTWRAKREEIQAKSLLILNQEITELSSWGEEAIRARGGRLFAVALKLWPHPRQDETTPTVSYAERANDLMNAAEQEEMTGLASANSASIWA